MRSQVNTRPPPTFFPLDEKMAFIPAAILGFQHMIAMLIGAKLQRAGLLSAAVRPARLRYAAAFCVRLLT